MGIEISLNDTKLTVTGPSFILQKMYKLLIKESILDSRK